MLLTAGLFSGAYNVRYFNQFGCGSLFASIINVAAALGMVLANYGFTKFADLFGWRASTQRWLAVGIVMVVLSVALIPAWGKFLKNTEKLRIFY